MCGKIIILAIITVSVGAQFASDRRFDGNRRNFRTNSGGFQPEFNQEYQSDENARTNIGQRNRHFSNRNGNGRNEGRLRTNLDSIPMFNYQPNVEDSPYVGELSRDQNVQFDIYSSQGRGAASQTGLNGEDRRQLQNYDDQREENPIINNNQRQKSNGQSNSRQRSQNNDNSRQNDKKYQNSQENRNKNDGLRNDDQTDSRNGGQNIVPNSQNIARNEQNNFNQRGNRNENNRANQNRRPNNGTRIDTNRTTIDNISRAIADRVAANRHDLNNEALDKEINNQISKMFFEESTEPKANDTKSTKDNELPRNGSGGRKKEEEMWVWSGDGVKPTTVSPTTPNVDDRAAFSADGCPTDHIKVNEKCVMKDKD